MSNRAVSVFVFTSEQTGVQYLSGRVERQRVGQQGFGQQTQVDEGSEVRGQVVCDDLTGFCAPRQHGLMEEGNNQCNRSINHSVCESVALI